MGEVAQLAQIVMVERRDAADRQRHAVYNDRPVRHDMLQDVRGIAEIADEILADDLEPVDTPRDGRCAQQMREMGGAQPHPVAQAGQAQATGFRERTRRPAPAHVDGGNTRRNVFDGAGSAGTVLPRCFITS